MDDRSLPPQLVDVFLQELQEHVSSFGDALTALARSPEYAATPLANALRAMHSLKGAARTLGLGELADACHDLESIIAAVQQGRLPLDHATTRLLFDAVDLIDQMGAALGGDGEVAHDALARLKRRLEAALQQASPETAPGPLIEQPPTTPTWRDSTVRVPAHRLDELLAQCVELLSHERSVATRAADLAVLQQRLGDWRRSWWQSPYDVRGWLRHANGQRPDRPAASRAQRQGQPTAASLSEFDRQLRRLRRDLELGHWRSTQSAEMLHELVRRSRLLPFREMSQGLDRVVRDLAEAEGKRVRLVVSGEHAELDRALLVALRDAVLHLVRNAVHHGIEQPGEREAAGKAGEGRIEIAVAVRGSLVEVRVEDDGRGLDVAALRQQAQRAGIGPGEQVDVTSLIFHSGVTAASEVGAVAGRGVGLDVVHSRVESLRGTIVASHGPGEGTRFIMQIPLTLTTVSGVLVRAAGQVFAIRSALVQAVVRPVDFAEPGAVRWNGRHVPAAPLAALLRLSEAPGRVRAWRGAALMMQLHDETVAVLVDEGLAERELVIKSLDRRLRSLRHVAATAVLDDGSVALVLRGPQLIRMVQEQAANPAQAARPATSAEPASTPPARVLVAEDSSATRAIVQRVLEAAGHRVLVAADGAAAWRTLEQQPVDLVVTDLQMPGMNGFDLIRRIRQMHLSARMPVLVLAAMEDVDDDALAELAADATLDKAGFDQAHLIELVGQLLASRQHEQDESP